MFEQEKPNLVGFVADLMFTTQIERVANHLGYQMRWIESAESFGTDTAAERPGEPIFGRNATMINQISAWQPALILVDLANDAVPWQKWIAILKTSPATRRIPILCFGSHVAVDTLQKARDVGADQVISRGRFTSAMPDLIQKIARRPDYSAALAACSEPLSSAALGGIELFNQRAFYEAHHGLEDAWNADQGPGRDLYRAILQVAVAYLQIERRNYRGAVKMFLRVRQWLEPLPDVCRSVNVAQLRVDAEAAYAALLALGPEYIADFDDALLQPVLMTK
jgi:predicted metal-dependent hydrolase